MNNKSKKAVSQNYFGNICLRVESAKNYTQVDQFCQQIETISNLEIMSRSWSAKKGLAVFVFLKDPTPLGDKMRQITLVDEVYKTKKSVITVVLNNSFGGTMSPSLTPPSESVFV